jgi:hypothetical protein
VSEFPAMIYQPREEEDEIGAPAEATSLEVMQAIYRNPKQPLTRRMRAAQIAIAYEHPKLSATYAVDGSRNFSAEMKSIAQRSGRGNVLDAKSDYRQPQLEAPPKAPTPELDAEGKMPPQGFRRRM